MSGIPVHTGFWHDHSQGTGPNGIVLTLGVVHANYLIAALSTFIGFVGTALWSLVAFIIHQCLFPRYREMDVQMMQHRVMHRNPSTALGMIWYLLYSLLSWRKHKNHHLLSTLLVIPPLLVFATFTVAGVFVSRVAGRSYTSNDVLVKPSRCGIPTWDLTVTGQRDERQRTLIDTLAARAYVTLCY